MSAGRVMIWALQQAGEVLIGLILLGIIWFCILCVAEWISERGWR